MSERKLDKLTDLGHLLAAATNIIVSNLVQVALFVLTLYRLAFAVDNCVLGNNAELWGIYLDNLELYLSHATASCEGVALSDGSVGFSEVRGEENVE
jgi:hypothetical protein